MPDELRCVVGICRQSVSVVLCAVEVALGEASAFGEAATSVLFALERCVAFGFA